MKINIIIPTILMGGGLRVAFQYANDWVERGHDVLVYVPMLYEEVDRKIKVRTSIANTFLRGTKIEWYDCKFPVKKAVNVSNQFIRNADITIAVGPCSARRVSRLNEKKGKKVLFIQGHEVNEQKTNLEDIDRTYQYGMHMVVITKYMRDYIYELTGEKAEVIYNGIPENEFISVPKISNEQKTIIMLANFSHYKGGYNGLEVLKRVKKKYNVRCVLYGLTKDEHIPDDFEFYQQPSRKRLMQLYREADICLFPSVEEGWGLIVTEAMANKCAVVGNRTGCLRDFGEHEINALITDEPDYTQMEKYIERLLNNQELLITLQENGYKEACKMKRNMSFEHFNQFLEDLK